MISRLEKVRKVLRREKADALLVWNSEGSGQPATRWISGFSGTASVLLVTKTKPFLITDGRYTTQARKEAKGFSVFISSTQKPTLKILATIAGKHAIQKILFDGTATTHHVVEEIKKTLPQADVVSKKYMLQELRIVKDTEEIRLLTESAEVACLAFTRLLPEIHAGMTEKEIAKRLEHLMAEEGAEGIAFPTIVASGKNGANPHARASDKKIKMGEFVTIDFGARYKGYVSDMTRTVAIGKVPLKLKEMYAAVQKAQELGCKKAKAGVTGAEIDAVCRKYLRKKGFGKYFTHSTGHGIGMEIHELPHISPTPSQSPPLKRGRGGNEKLSAGTVITIEPGVYIPNVGGVRIEDSLVLTKKNVNLTKTVSKKLFTC